LQAAERVWQAQGNEEKVGSVLALRGMMLLWQGEFQKSLEAVYQALEKLPEQDVFWRGVSLLNAAGGELYAGRILSAQDTILEARALLGASQNIFGMLAATGMMSEVLYAQGDLELCAQLNQQIMTEAVGGESMLDDQGQARLGLANVAYEQNNLETAARYAAEAFDLGQQRANELLLAQAASRLACIHVAQNEMAQAQDILKALTARLKTPAALREVRETEALIAVRLGQGEIQGETQTAWLATDQNLLPMQKEREDFILARLRIDGGRPVEALTMLQPHLADAAKQGRVRSQTEALCLEALAYQAAGDLTNARQALALALTLGYEKGFRRLFLDEGPPMAALFRDASRPPTLAKRPLHIYATALLHLFPPQVISDIKTGPDSLTLVEPLSQQEVRVLRLLVAGRSNAEIASELVVSTNTVKTHVKNIYSKLNINSREEARVMARELKLV
jgi:LuxR family maltose regulon positive regulatory protein